MAKLLEELVVMRKCETETMILKLAPHGLGPFPSIVTLLCFLQVQCL